MRTASCQMCIRGVSPDCGSILVSWLSPTDLMSVKAASTFNAGTDAAKFYPEPLSLRISEYLSADYIGSRKAFHSPPHFKAQAFELLRGLALHPSLRRPAFD